MNLLEKDLRVSADECPPLVIGNKFRVVHEDNTVDYYIMTHAKQSCYELFNIVTGEQLLFKRGTMFPKDVQRELDTLASNEFLGPDIKRIKSWAYIPDERFNLDINLKGLVL